MAERPNNPSLGIIVPCYNEEAVLPLLQAELRRFMDAIGLPVRVLLVDDGSQDGTFAALQEASRQDARFAGLRFSRNFGHQTAVSAGLRHIAGDMVAVLDADMQDPPSVIAAMIEKWREGYDVVYGIRTNRKEGLLMRAAYAAFYRILKAAANIDLPLDAGDFSLMDRRVVDYLNRLPEHNRFVRGLRGWVGFRQTGIPYERAARHAGAPKYNFRRLLNLALDGIISFSSLPLRMASWLGVLASGVGFGLLLWAVFSALVLQRTPSGWASLAVMLLFFSGVQLLVLGIFGEYLGRIFEEVKNRPHYIVSDLTGWAAEEAGPPRPAPRP
jgi:glycosyltransferase involved in cell wall biosynthesis